MTTFNEIYGFLDSKFPRSLSCEWDNDGVMLAPSEAETRRVLVTLDVTTAAAEYAAENGFDTVISHHPLIFKPLRSVVSPKLLALARAGIGVMSFHTRLDAGEGGVNDTLAGLLGLTDVRSFGTESPAGRVGRLPDTLSAAEFTALVSDRLGSPCVEAAVCGTRVSTLAILGGDGRDFYPDALVTGADAYLTGSMSYNSMADAAEGKMSVYAAGHYFTEQPVCDTLADLVAEAFAVETEVFECNPLIMY